MPDFIISDENIINRDRYRTMTGQGEEDGIVIKGYEDNMPVFYNHDWVLGKAPIGQTEKLVKKDGQLIATPVFDEKDADVATKRIIKKVNDGVIKGASVGLDVLEWSEDPDMMLKGQQRPTVVTSDLMEWSVTGIPLNKGAVRLSCRKKGVMLSADVDKAYLNILLPIIEKHPEKMKEVCKKLGLPENADEQQVVQAIEALNKRSIDLLLSMGKKAGVVTAQNEAHFKTLAAKDFDSTFALLQVQAPKPTTTAPTTPVTTETDPKPTTQGSEQDRIETLTETVKTLSKQLNGKGGNAQDNKENWDFDTWSTKDPQGLAELKQKNPDKYQTLAMAYKGRRN
jgi:hypothetical protein